MPGSAKRSAAKTGGRSTQRQGARPARRTGRRRNERNLARRVGWSRRIGVATALVVLSAQASRLPAVRSTTRRNGVLAPTPRDYGPHPGAPERALTRLARSTWKACCRPISIGQAPMCCGSSSTISWCASGASRTARASPREVPLDEGENQFAPRWWVRRRRRLFGAGRGHSGQHVPQIRITRPRTARRSTARPKHCAAEPNPGPALRSATRLRNLSKQLSLRRTIRAFLDSPGQQHVVLSARIRPERASTRFVVVRETSWPRST